jgi:tryptophan 2,3-dioxygenase
MPDEQIFIIYHQITELYFKMIILELEQVIEEGLMRVDFVLSKIQRINSYFEQLQNSFEIMLKGIEQDQFLKFRLSLSPASGFQSIQFRLIEILATEFNNLVDETNRDINDGVEEIYKKLYWRKGAIESSTGKETLTLVHFEKKYKNFIISKALEYKSKNLAYLCKRSLRSVHNDELVTELKRFDSFANIMWPLSHYKTAVKHLLKNAEVISSTGETNWRKYLPPKFRKVIFFPELWSQEEKENWGKSWFF